MRRMITILKRDSGIPSGDGGSYKSFEIYFDTIIGDTAVKTFPVKGIPISPVGDRTLVRNMSSDKWTVEWYDEDMEVISTAKPGKIGRVYWGDAGDILVGTWSNWGGLPAGAKSVKFSFAANDTSRVHTAATPIDLIVI